MPPKKYPKRANIPTEGSTNKTTSSGVKRRKKRKQQQKKNNTKKRQSWSPTPSDDSDQDVCLHFMHGKCTASEKGEGPCSFTHEVSVPKIMKPCKYYIANTCNLNDDSCRYLHQEFPCKFYHFFGRCTAGQNCRFSHERNESTIYLLENFIESQNMRLEANTLEASQPVPTEGTSAVTLDEQQTISNTVVPPELPHLTGFYRDTADVEEETSETPLPSVFDSLLCDVEPPGSPESSEQQNKTEEDSNDKWMEKLADDEEKIDSEIDYTYPSKIISVTLPPLGVLDNNSSSIAAASKKPPMNSTITWKLQKVGMRRIDYGDMRKASSVRDILMDPRLTKYRR